jgi:hypothetical protein
MLSFQVRTKKENRNSIVELRLQNNKQIHHTTSCTPGWKLVMLIIFY